MPALVIKAKKAGSQKKSLIVVVGKDFSKKSTQRNLFKRRIKTIMQPILKESSFDYTVIARPEARNLSFDDLKKEIKLKVHNG